jgi:hypothetical protein
LEAKASWVYGAAAVVALSAAALLIVAFLVVDAGVAEDVRSDVAHARR